MRHQAGYGVNGRKPAPAESPPPTGPVSARPAVHDPQLAAIFVNMRRMLGLPIDRLARVFGMPAPVIMALEAGRIDQLPDWVETLRVVRAYADAVGVDARPIYARLQVHMGPIDQRALLMNGAGPASAATGPPRTATAPPRSVVAAGETTATTAKTVTSPKTATVRSERSKTVPSAEKLKRRRRRMFALAPLAVLASLLAFVQFLPGVAYMVARNLPGPIKSPATSGLDFLVMATAPTREGLRWIDVGDPRARKSDKLRTVKR